MLVSYHSSVFWSTSVKTHSVSIDVLMNKINSIFRSYYFKDTRTSQAVSLSKLRICPGSCLLWLEFSLSLYGRRIILENSILEGFIAASWTQHHVLHLIRTKASIKFHLRTIGLGVSICRVSVYGFSHFFLSSAVFLLRFHPHHSLTTFQHLIHFTLVVASFRKTIFKYYVT